jgi:hypothetical protein
LSRQAEAIQDNKLTPQAKALVHEGKLKEADALLRQSAISMAQFQAIQTGMSYQEVVKVLGRPGVEGASGRNIINYTWRNLDWSMVGVLFVNGRVEVKTPAGLR